VRLPPVSGVGITLGCMGIHNFYSILSILGPKFRVIDIFAECQSGLPVDHLLVDLNNALYLASSHRSDDRVIKSVCRYIKRLLLVFAPKKSVFLALDGPGPKAKFLAQRMRREQAVEHSLLTAKFTAGTNFMIRLKDALCLLVTQCLVTNSQYRQGRSRSSKHFL
jgi:5'-3' exonuclease